MPRPIPPPKDPGADYVPSQAGFTQPAPGEVALYRWELAVPEDALARLQQILSQEERQRADALVNDRVRMAFVAARAGLRQALGATTGQTPESIKLEYTANGKPQLAGKQPLHFNLAHSGGVALLAIASEPVGVDLEMHRGVTNEAGLVERWFSVAERRRYEVCPPAERRALFFCLWTGKEAVLKLHGGAVGESLREIQPPTDAQQGQVEPTRDTPQACWVTRLELGEGWSAAVASHSKLSTAPVVRSASLPELLKDD